MKCDKEIKNKIFHKKRILISTGWICSKCGAVSRMTTDIKCRKCNNPRQEGNK